MRAILCERLGEPDTLRLVERPMPEPKAGEALVRVHAAGVNFPDVLMVRGAYQMKPELPFIPGIEAAGEIAALGPGVTGWRVGQRVLAGVPTGAFAEYAVAKAQPLSLVPLPDHWSFAEGAGFRVATLTAYHGLVQCAGLKARETVLVHGASGGVGLAAVQLAKHLGANVIATGGSDAKLAVVKSYGADHVLNITADGDWVAKVKALTEGQGVNVVFDPVGGDVLAKSVRASAIAGRLLVIGFTSGGPTQLPSNHILIKRISVIGIRAGEAVRGDPVLAVDWVAAMPRLLGSADMRPHISIREPLERASAALQALIDRRVIGKAVIEMR